MAYNQNIPQATDTLDVSQPQLLANFQAIKTLVDVNHVTFDDPSGDQGKHKWVSFPIQGSAPIFGAGEEGLYNLAYANGSGTANELFVHKLISAGTADIPMTASILSQMLPGSNTNGWSYLPSGILIHWQSATAQTGLVTVTVNAGFPAFTAIFTVIVSAYSAATTDADFAVRFVDILSPTQFRVFVSNRTTTGAGTGGFKALIIGY